MQAITAIAIDASTSKMASQMNTTATIKNLSRENKNAPWGMLTHGAYRLLYHRFLSATHKRILTDKQTSE